MQLYAWFPEGLLGIKDVKHGQVLKMTGFWDSMLNEIVSSTQFEIYIWIAF